MRWQATIWKVAAGVASGLLAFAAPDSTAVPGTLNYLEGQASIDNRALDPRSVENQVLQPGEVLQTQNGKVEMLLTPGVFLRLGENSQARLVSPGLADTEVALVKGQATVEADAWSKNNRLKIDENGATVQIEKKGFYVLNSKPPFVQVLDGKVKVLAGDQHVNVGKDREAVLEINGKLKARNFDDKAVKEASLVRWSRLRSETEAEASYTAAQNVYAIGGWYGPGWYWAEPYGFWSYLPGDGILFSPFGWGFYSPGFVYYGGPYFYGGGGYFYGGRPYFGRVHPGPFRGGFHGGGFVRSGGFAGGMRGGRR